MKTKLTEGLIMLRDDLDLEYKIAKISYLVREDDTFEYTIEPYYNVIDLISAPYFQGIPGIDLSLRRQKYTRINQVPVFISERAPSAHRVNLDELLEEVNMKYLNPLEWLINTTSRYSGDSFYVTKYDLKYEVPLYISCEVVPRSAATSCKTVLDGITHGQIVYYGSMLISDMNRSDMYKILRCILANDKCKNKVARAQGMKNGKENINRGRKKVKVDELLFDDLYQKYKKGRITGEIAAKKLGISRSTFLRRVNS